jgi:hypothetical protein
MIDGTYPEKIVEGTTMVSVSEHTGQWTKADMISLEQS